MIIENMQKLLQCLDYSGGSIGGDGDDRPFRLFEKIFLAISTWSLQPIIKKA